MTFIEPDGISQGKAPDPERGLFSTVEPMVADEPPMALPQLERRSGHTTMTRMERDTYDLARGYQGERFLFVPRMGIHGPHKVIDRLSSNHARPDTRVVLVDGPDAAEVPYADFQGIDPRLFVEILRYAHGRHLRDRPGHLIELTERLIQKNP